ncbi:MAG: acyl-CoA thioesterase [Rhizobacter sp.]
MPEISKSPALTYPPHDPSVQLPTDRELVMRVMPMPADTNSNGAVFGGWIMAQMDLAGSVLPAKLSKGRVTTVAVNEFVFKQPVSVGDLLSFYAKVVRVGNTSITVQIDVYAERNPADLHVVKVTEAVFTYVAIDDAGKPRPVPPQTEGGC